MFLLLFFIEVWLMGESTTDISCYTVEESTIRMQCILAGKMSGTYKLYGHTLELGRVKHINNLECFDICIIEKIIRQLPVLSKVEMVSIFSLKSKLYRQRKFV